VTSHQISPGGPGAGTGPPGEEDGQATGDRRAVLRDSVGVGAAVGVSGIAFGTTAAAAGLTVPQACALSLLAFTGGSQFALVAAVAGGGSPLAGAAGALMLGARNALYAMRLRPLLGLPRGSRLACAHLVVDETTAVTLAQPGRRAARLGFITTGVTLFVLWNATTLLGAAGTAAIGDPSRYGLDAAGPAAFLALVAPQAARGRRELATAVLAAALALATTPLLPPGIPVLVALAAVPAVMAATRKAGLP
jgi:branched chain amino acid efflux pump